MANGKHFQERAAIGRTIRSIRRKAGLSLRQLAALCTIDHADIGRIENARTNAGLGQLIELAITLGVPPEDFFTGELKKIKRSPK